ncbi:MAG TPA: 16S rRNA (guanine(966)-N(2))-methyltransferase RsmD [Candidatus Aminicenantes bacterium]|nr:16S rRNA (guanine(966)-N(2))-methyltransferase RsmD [Candidatus Aminicenantes bacterium]
MLRISAGLYKGRALAAGSDPQVRPTMARVKLSFFDSVQEGIRDSIFLDGFSGSGHIGIEALSRGAEYVVFIDQLPEAVAVLRKNLDKIGIESDHYRIICGDFNRSVIQLAKEGFQFDYIYLDPPYDLLEVANPLKVVFKRGIYKADGLIVLERRGSTRFDAKYFERWRSKEIGREALDFYRPFPPTPATQTK